MSRPLTAADEVILRALHAYRYLTAAQLTRLLYAPGSLTYVQTKLKGLRERGVVQAIFLPRRTQAGSAPSVYTLARAGQRQVAQLGITIPPRARPGEETGRSYLFLSHTLAVNDVVIAAALLTRHQNAVQLAAWQHEHEIKHRPLAVSLGHNKRQLVVPDAWLDFRVPGGEQVCVLLELDRGTEDRSQWTKKLAGLLAALQGPYQAAFDTDSAVVAVLTTAGDVRAGALLAWSESVLKEQHQERLAQAFCFQAAQPGAVSPQDLFLAPSWRAPFQPDRVPLVY